MSQQQVIRNRNLRWLLNNLHEDRITIRKFLISAGNQFEFDYGDDEDNNAGEFGDYYLPMEEARAAFEMLLFVGELLGEHFDGR
jgi:hypothetical protein